ncbi:MAG: GAF domain-containing protein [Polaromonas sp.]|uniref:GAF domain-containing protein n=1 Tax=Polaromonas sp. TaxID=1869339 RepID=UPI0018213D68|nr:GAF domain-containing protein [Polaromonas sp.]MBA3595504.1 GAF domain-containing protein [Polaromonas sp.]
MFNQDQACLDLARSAAQLCDTPIALVSLKVEDRQWFQTRVGLDAKEIPSRESFCECAMQFCDEVLVVEDAKTDPRFADNALVTGPLGIRFYAGAPLVTSKKGVLGNLCVLDVKPKKMNPEQLEMLAFLSKQVAIILEEKLDSLPA